MVHPHYARAVRNLVEALDTNQTSHPARAEYGKDIVGALGKRELPGIPGDENMD